MRVWLLLACLCAWPALAEDYPAPVENCCRYCTPNSQPCGGGCIPLGYTCHKGEGCACSSANRKPGQGGIYQEGFTDGLSIGLHTARQIMLECGACPECVQFLDAYANAGTLL